MIEKRAGDAVYFHAPEKNVTHVLLHIVNNKGGWGRGFVVGLSKRWAEPERAFRQSTLRLGECQLVVVSPDTLVVNMCAQDGYSKPGYPACSLVALEECLHFMALVARAYPRPIIFHMPRFGSGLGGRVWETEIEPLIEQALGSFTCRVYMPIMG